MKVRTLVLLIALVGVATPSVVGAEVYRSSGQGAYAGLYKSDYDSETGVYTATTLQIQVGEIEAANPPNSREHLLLFSAYLDIFECDDVGNCTYRDLYSGEVDISPEAVVFGRNSTTAYLNTVVDLFDYMDPTSPVPLEIILAWDAAGAKPSRTNNHYHHLSQWEVTNQHYSSVSREAQVTGSVVLGGIDLLNEGYEAMGAIEFGRSGEVIIFRNSF